MAAKKYVFISYSSKNVTEAEAVRKILDDRGLQSWMAPYNIPAGAKYAYAIDEAIENCACVLLLLTQEAQESNHVDREIERALSYKKEIIPMRLDHGSLNSGFRYYIGNCHIVDVSAIDAACEEMQTVIRRLEQVLWKEMDNFLLLFEKEFKQWEKREKTYIVDPKRMQLLKSIYEEMKILLQNEGYEEDDYTIAIEPDPLETGNVAFTIVCDDLVIKDIKAFCDIVQHLQNFEIYPIDGDKLRFAGVFLGLFRIYSA